MKIRNEKDLRKWIANRYNDCVVLWFEPAAGSTQGLPDGAIVDKGRVIFFELKVTGSLKQIGPSEFNYRHQLRPAQVACIRRITRNGARVIIVVGVQYTDQVYWADLGAMYTMAGNLPEELLLTALRTGGL